MTRTGTLLGFVLMTLLVFTACGRGADNDDAPTETSDDVFVIVTLTAVPSATTRSEMVDYVVAEGDTLSGIADEFGVDAQDIVQANNLPNPDAIFVGQTLSIPAPEEATPES